jgi:hypothetical protein
MPQLRQEPVPPVARPIPERTFGLFMRGALLVALLLTLGGCIQMHTTLHVRRDGSGTIEQRLLFTGILREVMKPADGKGEASRDSLLPKAVRLREMSTEFGPGVRIVDVRPVATREGRGFLATYAYPDINRVRIGNVTRQGMSLASDSTASKPDSTARVKPENWFSFSMKPGRHPELTILKQSELFASTETVSGPGAASGKDGTQMLDMITPFLKGMSMVVDVVVDGRITRSSASHRAGNRIVLYSLDFGRLLAHRELFTRMGKGVSDRDFARKAGRNSGLTFESKPQVVVGFD